MSSVPALMTKLSEQMDREPAREPDEILTFLSPSVFLRYQAKGWLTPYHRVVQPMHGFSAHDIWARR